MEIQILNMIKKDNKISTEKMAMTLGISSKTVKRHIKDIGILPSERFVIWGRKKETLMQWQENCFRALD